jgi:hypothetical protein
MHGMTVTPGGLGGSRTASVAHAIGGAAVARSVDIAR